MLRPGSHTGKNPGMSYSLAILVTLTTLGILALRLARRRHAHLRGLGDYEELIANRNATLLIGEHFALAQKRAVPSRYPDEA